MAVLKNQRHERFAQELASGKTAYEAYKMAGYKPDRGAASRLSAKVSIKDRVAEILGKGAERAEITQEMVLRELGRIGFSDIRKAFTPGGHILAPEDWEDDFAAAVAGVEVVTRNTGEKDENDRPVIEHVHKFRTWDKRAALVDIGKHLGMFENDKGQSGEIHIHFDGLLKGVL